MKAFFNYPSCLRSIQARFSAPTLPGEVIELVTWRLRDEAASRATVRVRNGKLNVLSHGRPTLALDPHDHIFD